MTHETSGPTIRTDGITTAAHDALGLPYVHGADSRRSDDADDDVDVDEDSGDDDDAENESADDGVRANGAREMDGIDDLGF